MLCVEEFRKRLAIYWKMDPKNRFDDFWNWKLGIEKENGKKHILDPDNRHVAHNKLCEMAKEWQVYRKSKNEGWEKH